MKYDIVCIDIDGTLLGKNHSYSDRTKSIIEECTKKGVHIVLATGRLFNNAAYYGRQLGLKSPIIATNGAVISNENGEIIKTSSIPFEKAMEISKLLIKYKVAFQIYTIKDIYCDSLLCYLGSKYIMTKQIMPTNFDINYKITGTLKRMEQAIHKSNDGVAKFIALSTRPEKIARLKEELKKIKDIEIYGSGRRSVEINYVGVSKGNAIEYLADLNKVPRERVMCIGDNENDISMIKYAGMGVAMGNAISELKDVADYITDTNIEDGVAKALEKLVLNR